MGRKLAAKRNGKFRHGDSKRKRMRLYSRAPSAISKEERPQLEKRLGQLSEWDESQPVLSNYKEMGVVANPNFSMSDRRACPLKPKAKRVREGEATFSDDDELRAASGIPRKSGTAPPRRITSREREFIRKLIEKHGDDLEAMKWDTKLNVFQHSVGKLKKYLESYHFWKPDQGLSLTVPAAKISKVRFYRDHLNEMRQRNGRIVSRFK